MDKKTRLIIIGVLSIIIVILLSLGLTKAFMKPVEQGGNLTEISLDSCAKIKLTGTSSINLSSSYPMSRNRGLQTTPYSLTVTSYCDSYVGFNLYIATLNTNTLTDENIHYILTEKGSKTAVVEGILSSATDGSSDFSDTDKTELNTGLKGTYGSIYKIHNTTVALKGNKQYDLYLFVDESSTNTSMKKTFKAGVAVKAYDREKDQTLAEYVISQYTGTQGENSIYYHNSTLANGAGDNSYRYAGANPNNYVCFGSDTTTCSEDNLYRIIGVFGNQVKLIKATIAKSNLLGTDGAYSSDTEYYWSTLSSCPSSTAYNSNNGIYQLANKNIIAAHDIGIGCNEWNYSNLNTTNLNTNFINNIGTTWASKIATTTWKVGGGTWSNIATSVPATAYKNEVGSSSSTTTVNKKIGLMYVSDYYYSASPSAWTLVGYNSSDATKDYRAATSTNWLYLGSTEWTISRDSDDTNYAFRVTSTGDVNFSIVDSRSFAVRPSFNLESSVKYVSGSGSMSDPVRVN